MLSPPLRPALVATLASLLVPFLASYQDETAPPAKPGLELPDSPAAKAWASVGADTLPAALPSDFSEWRDASVWNETATWERWAELVGAEAAEAAETNGAAGGHDPQRRAALCLLARAHGRASDAWQHYRALSAHPEWVAAVTSYLIPGVPPGSPVESGGSPAALPPKAVLQPLLPPPSGDLPRGAIEWRTATHRGLRVGETTVDFSITVENSGVQIDLTHVSGPATELSVLLPAPEGYETRVEYLDWMRRETQGEPIPVELAPGDETHSVFGRIIESRSAMPTGSTRRLPKQMVEGGLFLELPADDPDREQIDSIARVLGTLLGVRVELVTSGTAHGSWTGTTLRLPAGPERAARLRYLASSVETFLLD